MRRLIPLLALGLIAVPAATMPASAAPASRAGGTPSAAAPATPPGLAKGTPPGQAKRVPSDYWSSEDTAALVETSDGSDPLEPYQPLTAEAQPADEELQTTQTVEASAASGCSAPYRWASSSNRVYVTEGTVTLSDIVAGCPSAPIRLVDSAAAVWEVGADIIIQNGATLRLHGTARGGDVDQLRLESGSSGALADVVTITAQYGTVDLAGTSVTSWDPAAGAPDTTTAVPSGGTRGRAFIRVISFMEGSTPRTSRMDIVDSDIGYLGYYAAESYGIAYKARGCGVETPEVCDVLDVLGKQVNSRFHHNYMGTYTWGAYGMEFTGNEYSHNETYGLDPHDDSDHLLVTGNSFHHNGNHGFICSQRCDHLTVTHNESHDNGLGSSAQTHGIMLHRGVTDTVVAHNRVWNNATGGGIALFDSIGNVVRDNYLAGNRYGLRFSVGASGTLVEGNVVEDSLQYAVYSYKGSDTSIYTGDSGRPSDLLLDGNTLTGSGSSIVKFTDSDRFELRNTVMGGTIAAGPRWERGQGHVYDVSNSAPSGLTFTLKGTATAPTSVEFRGIQRGSLKVSTDSYSTATYTG